MSEAFSPIQEISQMYNPLIASITTAYISRPESLKNLSIEEYVLYYCQEYQKVSTAALQVRATMNFDGNYVLENNAPKR